MSLSIGLGLGVTFALSQGGGVQGFSSVKSLLAADQDAVLFVNADSTGYTDFGPFYKFATAIGDLYDCDVTLHRWAEWEVSAATGPKAYSAPVSLRSGAGPTLTVYLASLPGANAGAMFAGSRKPAAIDAIPTPDCVILHHGHNMSTFEQTPSGTTYSGRGMLYGPIGMAEMQWPGVPQVMTTQNPRRDDTSYARVYDAQMAIKAAHTGLTVIDTHAAFIAAGKAGTLYRDNIHPSDASGNSAGAQLIADTIFAAFAASPVSDFTMPSWPRLTKAPLISNGDFSNWTGAMPVGWTTSTAVVTKDSVNQYGDAPYCLAMTPEGNQNSLVQMYLDPTAAAAALGGKTISVAVLAKAPASRPASIVSVNIILRVAGATPGINTGSQFYAALDGWMWYVIAGIPVDAVQSGGLYIRVSPAFGASAPINNDPTFIQHVAVVEGSLPIGNFAYEISAPGATAGQPIGLLLALTKAA